MEIHALESSVHSFKDFAIHIAVVTVGILIALGLEGIREKVHERHLVRETRENFREELKQSQENMALERQRIEAGYTVLKALSDEAPALAQQHPEQVLARLDSIHNPNYFFATNAWQASLSTGALALMSSDEVTNYAWAAEGTRIYTGFQAQGIQAEHRALAFWRAHPHPTPSEISEGEERILDFEQAQQTLVYVAPQTQKGFEHALQFAVR